VERRPESLGAVGTPSRGAIVAAVMVFAPHLAVPVPGVHARASDATRIGNLLAAGQLGSFAANPALLVKELASNLGWPGSRWRWPRRFILARAERGTGCGSASRSPPWCFWCRRSCRARVRALSACGASAARGAGRRGDDAFVSRASPRPLVASVAAALLVLAVAPAGFGAAASGRDTTQGLARRWIESHVPRDALIIQEKYAAHWQSVSRLGASGSSAAYERASEPWRRRFAARPRCTR